MAHSHRCAVKQAAVALIASFVLVAAPAQANPLDLNLVGLGPYDETAGVVDSGESFRLLSAELGLNLMPKTLATAETLGMAGFEVGFDGALLLLNSGSAHWQGATESGTPAPEQGSVGLNVRKGLPFHFELEANMRYLINSSMFVVGGSLRYSFLEGYKYVPNIALRVGVSRLLNAVDIDLTMLHFDLTISKTFPVGGVMTIAPIIGWGMVLINANSAVLDSTPGDKEDNKATTSGPNPSPGSLYTLPSQGFDTNFHQRAFVGLQIQTYIVSVLYQLDFGFITNGPFTLQNSFKFAFSF